MISKEERRNRLIDDFRIIAKLNGKDENEMVMFAKSISDEMLDYFESLGFSSEKKVRIMKGDELIFESKTENF